MINNRCLILCCYTNGHIYMPASFSRIMLSIIIIPTISTCYFVWGIFNFYLININPIGSSNRLFNTLIIRIINNSSIYIKTIDSRCCSHGITILILYI